MIEEKDERRMKRGGGVNSSMYVVSGLDFYYNLDVTLNWMCVYLS